MIRLLLWMGLRLESPRICRLPMILLLRMMGEQGDRGREADIGGRIYLHDAV